LLSRGNNFAAMSMHSRQKISEYGGQFIHDGCTVLVHGRSRVVSGLLKYAAQRGKQFSVILTEGRPKNEAQFIADELISVGIPVSVILDSAVAHKMEEVDFVLFGAEGVVENGGIINIIGTYQISIVAQSMNKPVYVAAESFKFTRMFPLTQKDIPSAIQRQHSELEDKRSSSSPDNLAATRKQVKVESPACDYTPPKFITLLFTDLGILTPSAVSDELIKLYY
jgi:translation initiation factor eIF-2B subunit alpha